MSEYPHIENDVEEDREEFFITVTDVKHYFYCPKIVYFEKVLHSRPVLGSQQIKSGKMHEKIERIEKLQKQQNNVLRTYKVAIYSYKYRLSGTVDCILNDVTKKEYIPLEYKYMYSRKGREWTDHKYQLISYAILIEENYKTVVRRGIIKYVPENKVVELEITEEMKNYLKRIIINAIHNIIKDEREPLARIPESEMQRRLWLFGNMWRDME